MCSWLVVGCIKVGRRNFIVWLAGRAGKMKPILCRDWLSVLSRWSYLARSELPVIRVPLFTLLAKFVRSRWWYIGLVLFLHGYGPRFRLKGLGESHYRAFSHDVIAAILVFPYKGILMSFFCLVHQHGCHGLCHTAPRGLSENALYSTLEWILLAYGSYEHKSHRLQLIAKLSVSRSFSLSANFQRENIASFSV